jgi:predicted glutamine amidotransferase
MCRLLAAVASEPTQFRLTLREAPRSLSFLSREHRDGWGIGVYSAAGGWSVERGTLCADDDEEFHEVAAGSRGEILVAHVRKRTVGAISIDNTHPFRHGRWVFAHNGTIQDLDWLRRATPPDRLAAIRGQTDSELFFAFLLSRLEREPAALAGDADAADRALVRALGELADRPAFGACNFVLSDGVTLYAHRSGRTLFLLERIPGDEVRVERESAETGALVETAWSPARHAVLVASERVTDEPWQPVDEGKLLRIDRFPVPQWRDVSRAQRS